METFLTRNLNQYPHVCQLSTAGFISRLCILRFSSEAVSSVSLRHQSSSTFSPWAEEERPGPVSLSSTEAFTETASICREFLSTFLAGAVLDSLSEAARQVRHVTWESWTRDT